MGRGLGIRAKLSIGKRKRDDYSTRRDDSIEYFGYADDYPMKKKKKNDERRKKMLKEGDIINLSEILFTEDRDFLIKYNGQQVRAEHLKDKVIVLHFVPLVPLSSFLKLYIETLVDIYKSLLSKSVAFEVVFIGFKVTKRSIRSRIVPNSSLQYYFNKVFSIMPWTAIPFSNINTLSYWENLLKYPIHHFLTDFLPLSLVIDPTGMVSQLGAGNIFLVFGAEAYPFTDKRIRYLQRQDDKALDSTSITKLLTSHGLDHVINNQNQKVPVKDLEGKVVALYFYEDFGSDFDDFEKRLKKAYDDLEKEDRNNFEIVLVYIHDSVDACKNASKASFWTALCSMPWLALPYRDPRCKNLKRIFEYPCDLEASGSDPRLAIIGPHGTYVEPYGADILKLFNFATSAYPFTRSKAAKLDVENIKNLSLLDIFRDPNPSFDRADGYKVTFSQLAGKKIILIIEDGWPPLTCTRFFSRLKRRYGLREEMGDPFEVIHAPQISMESSYREYVSTMPWLSCPKESYKSEVVWRHLRGGSGLLAFDGDGRVVRKTIFPQIKKGNQCFPFSDGGLEKEALKDLIGYFEWP